jgi:hypothetical protein
MSRRLSALAIAGALFVPSVALAEDFPRSINEPPRGPGTEQPPRIRTSSERIRPGWELGVQAGGGIGFGLGGRAGYSFVPGIYVGGAVTHFFGSSVETPTGSDSTSQTIFGGEVGYKIYPQPRFELRPFLFAGAGVFNQKNDASGFVDTNTKFALAPGFLAAYHIGNAFVSAEARLEVTPTPVNLAILGGIGIGL